MLIFDLNLFEIIALIAYFNEYNFLYLHQINKMVLIQILSLKIHFINQKQKKNRVGTKGR